MGVKGPFLRKCAEQIEQLTCGIGRVVASALGHDRLVRVYLLSHQARAAGREVEIYFGRKSLAAILGVLAAIFIFHSNLIGILVGVVLAAGAPFYPELRGFARRLIEERRSLEELPLLVDVLNACADGGLPLVSSLEVAIMSMTTGLTTGLQLLVESEKLGLSLQWFEESVAERFWSAEIREFFDIFALLVRMGGSYKNAISGIAFQVERKRESKMEQKVARTQVASVFPVVIFFLPSFLLIIVVMFISPVFIGM